LDLRLLLPADATEELLLNLLEREQLHIDELCRQTELPTATVSVVWGMLELKGLARNLANMVYGAA
jgi:hypothetical protein